MAEPVEQKEAYAHVNIFTETQDIPIIKPKTTMNNKNEFHLVMEKRDLPDDMLNIKQPIIDEFEQTVFPQKLQ